MKKIRSAVVFLLAAVLVFQLTGCGKDPAAGAKIDYGSSSIYSKEDMDQTVRTILKEFGKWDGCVLHELVYGTDDMCTEENVAWMNELEAANDAKEQFTQCIMFTSNFVAPENGGGAWEAGQEYTDWQWWLARSDGGKWKLMTWGY